MFTTQQNTDITTAIQKNALLIDVRTEAEFNNGSIPGARNIPLHALGAAVEKLATGQPVIVFCRSGSKSQVAVKFLEQAGINGVIDGGAIHNLKKYF